MMWFLLIAAALLVLLGFVLGAHVLFFVAGGCLVLALILVVLGWRGVP